jgi:hypothetical protein
MMRGIENAENTMKKEEVKNLIREYLVLRKKTESRSKEIRASEERYEQVGDLVYGFRSRSFIQFENLCQLS